MLVYQMVSQIQRSYKENHQPKSAENPWSFPPSVKHCQGSLTCAITKQKRQRVDSKEKLMG